MRRIASVAAARTQRNAFVPRPTQTPAAAPRTAHLSVLTRSAACSAYQRLSSASRGVVSGSGSGGSSGVIGRGARPASVPPVDAEARGDARAGIVEGRRLAGREIRQGETVLRVLRVRQVRQVEARPKRAERLRETQVDDR